MQNVKSIYISLKRLKIIIKAKKKLCLFPVTRPTLFETPPPPPPPTQNFLLTQGEKKRGKHIFDSCELISNQIDNFKTCLSLSCRVNTSKFNVLMSVLDFAAL